MAANQSLEPEGPRPAEEVRQQDACTIDIAAHSAADQQTAALPAGSANGGSQNSQTAVVPAIETRTRKGQLPNVPGYEILGELGRGGMGVVYKARHVQLRRLVALKMIRGGASAGEDELQRFRTEAEATARLQHPFIVQIFEIGEFDGMPFFALEYCGGGSLAKTLGGTPLPGRQAAALTEKLSRAVHAAHEQGIIHRDLKPANILMHVGERTLPATDSQQNASKDNKSSATHVESAVPKITDFGLAKMLENDRGQTESGAFLGTPSYAAPEQMGGSKSAIGPHTDVYALGAILYELLTGRPPFKGATLIDTIQMVISKEPVPVRLLNPSVPQELEIICLKCLDKNIARRYASAADLAEDLRRWQNHEPISARRPGPVGLTVRWCRRHPALTTIAAVIVLALAGIVWKWRDAVAAEQGAAAARDIAEMRGRELEKRGQELEKRTLELARERDNVNRELFESLLAQAHGNRLSRRVGQRFRSLELIRKATDLAKTIKLPPERFIELRNEAIAALALPDLSLVKQWEEPEGTPTAFDSNLERYARVDLQGTLLICRSGDGQQIQRLPGQAPGEYVPFWSADDAYLGIVRPGQLAVWKLSGDKPARILNLDQVNACRPAFSADGREIAVQQPDNAIVVYDLETGKIDRKMPMPQAFFRLAFHPRGKLLAASRAGEFQVLNVHTGKLVWQTKVGGGDFQEMAWRPDSDILAGTADQETALEFFDVAKQQAIGKFEMDARGVTFDMDQSGRFLVSNGWEAIFRIWDARSGRVLFSMPSGCREPRFSRNGRFVAYHENKRLFIWELEPGQEYRTYVSRPGNGKNNHQDVAISPDGRWLTALCEGHVVLWDAASGVEVASLSGRFPLWEEPAPAEAEQGIMSFLVMGQNGVSRWPVRTEAVPAGARLYMGPPQKVPVPQGYSMFTQTSDRQVLAWAGTKGAFAVRADQPNRPAPLQPHGDVRFVAVSPDARWAATGSFWAPGGARAWRLDSTAKGLTAKLAADLPAGEQCRLAFSLDNKYLLTCGFGHKDAVLLRRWEVGTWREKPWPQRVEVGYHFEAHFAFSPEGKAVAVDSPAGVVRLIDLETGADYARLEGPHQHRNDRFVFSADGTRLACNSFDGGCVYVWDLRAIRRQLADMGLDWDLPPLPPAAQQSSPKIVDVSLDPGGWRDKAGKLAVGRQWQEAALAFEKANYEDPLDSISWFDRALLLVRIGDLDGYRKMCRQMHERLGKSDRWDDNAHLAHACSLAPGALDDPTLPRKHAEKRLALTPGTRDPWLYHIQALATYRAGEYDLAITRLEKCLKDFPRWKAAALNDLVLAMAHHQLQHRTEAQQLLQRANESIRVLNRDHPAADNGFVPSGWHWREWITVELLQREAQMLIRK